MMRLEMLGFAVCATCLISGSLGQLGGFIASSDLTQQQTLTKTNSLLEKYGLRGETYRVTTEDKYVVQLTRIISPKGNRGDPVLVTHGIVVASDSWLLLGNESLPIVLIENGYDVWLGDERGNHYSREHQQLSPLQPSFWNFSFHEIGMYDIPAFIDKMIEVTGRPKIYYVGHSMGAVVFLVATSLRPEYNDKIKAAVMLANTSPCLEHLNPLMKFAIMNRNLFYRISQVFGFKELPQLPWMSILFSGVCGGPGTIAQELCLSIMQLFLGEHRGNLNRDVVGGIAGSTAGYSVKALNHLGQVVATGFRQYDHGARLNMRNYNSTEPPLYPLNAVTAPTAFFYGENDRVVCGEGVTKLGNSVANPIFVKKVADPNFSHLDFIAGNNAKKLVYDDIVRIFKKFK